MRTKFINLLIITTSLLHVSAQENGDKYRRSSLYSILIQHPEKKFCNEIVEIFDSIPFPDKFDNHNLDLRVIDPVTEKKTKKKKNDIQQEAVDVFLHENQIASQLIAKWFNRDEETGAFNVDLITERGIYDASALDREMAENSARGFAMLADAGEELIGNTFVLVNDIHYVDKEERAKVVSGIFGAISEVGKAVGGDVGNLVASSADLGGLISD
ncbi:MAG: hypothetical protein LIP01_15635, partial [Tannerellaceae bacterium]|nr:hypothetical protein [Tannerellaceae bacterium]